MCAPEPDRQPSAIWVVVIDVGGSSAKCGTFAPDGRLVRQARTPLDSGGTATAIADALGAAVEDCLQAVPGDAAWRLGVGFPGPFDYERGISQVHGVAKFEALRGHDLGAALRARWSRAPERLRFVNDAEAAIRGEVAVGAGCGRDRVLGITLGTGLGSAFLVGGEPVAAGGGVPPHGWLYDQPWREAQADETFSTRGLLARAGATGGGMANVPMLWAKAGRGDEAARAVGRAWGEELGAFLLPYAQAFRAESVIVLGGLVHGWVWFGPALGKVLDLCAVLPGSLGDRAALEGLRQSVSEPVRKPGAWPR